MGIRRGALWFEDGNLILYTFCSRSQCGSQQTSGHDAIPICFRVHRGFLARQSELFKTLLEIPQPENETISLFTGGDVSSDEDWKGCWFVEVHDDAAEMANFLMALYDGFQQKYDSVDDFFYLAGILHLSTKYLIPNLRKCAISALSQVWSHTLEGHDAMVERALREEMHNPQVETRDQQDSGSLRYPYAHPIHVLNLARTLDVPILIPSALYFASVYPVSDILRADHPKLVAGVKAMGDVLSSVLSREDLENVALMNEHRISIMLNFSRSFLGCREPSELCTNSHMNTYDHASCVRGFASLSSKASRSWYPRTGPLRWIQQVVRMADKGDLLCGPCRRELQTDAEEYRKKLWKELPGVVRMPDWERLSGDDTS